MAYNPFNDNLPDGSNGGPQVITDIRSNLQAMRDMIIVGGMVGWAMSASGGTAEQPAQILYTKGLERIKSVLTWGTSGGSNGNVEQSIYSYSSNSGTNYDAITTLSVTYDASGNATATAWS